jgi:hypothetical protein
MPERKITVMDLEPSRLRATASVLARLFPGVPLRTVEWGIYGNGSLAGTVAWQLLEDAARGGQLLTTNIDGLRSGLVGTLMNLQAGRIHCILTTCSSPECIESALERQNMSLSPHIGYVECPNETAIPLAERSGGHRERLEAYLAALPGDHPFSIGSRSTTYSTRESETYAASSR